MHKWKLLGTALILVLYLPCFVHISWWVKYRRYKVLDHIFFPTAIGFLLMASLILIHRRPMKTELVSLN